MTGPPRKPVHQWDLMDMLDARNSGAEAEALEELKELILNQEEWEPEDYSLIPDDVVALSKKKYFDWPSALRRFAELAEKRELVPIKMGETARDYYFECLRKVKQ